MVSFMDSPELEIGCGLSHRSANLPATCGCNERELKVSSVCCTSHKNR